MNDTIVRIGALTQISPTVNFANHSTVSTDVYWGPRWIPDCQLICVISGQLTLQYGGKKYMMNANQGAFYGKEIPHYLKVTSSGPLTYSSIHFSWNMHSPEPVDPIPLLRTDRSADLSRPAALYNLDVDGYGEFTIPHHFTMPHLENMFLPIVREFRNREPGYTIVLRSLLTNLITKIIRLQFSVHSSHADYEKIVPAFQSIREYPDIQWTIQKLASMCGYHPTYFAAVFKKVTGYSPKYYLMKERIQKAKELLSEAVAIESVAEALGYASVHYFSRNFKEMTGITPSQYKQRSIQI